MIDVCIYLATVKSCGSRMLTSLFCLVSTFTFATPLANEVPDYRIYHNQIIKAEKLISESHFDKALDVFDEVFTTFEFVFLREYQIAAQLALYLDERERAIQYITEGVAAGWELKNLKKHRYLSELRNHPEWEVMEADYPNLRSEYLKRIDNATRESVRKMFNKDQWKALGALCRIGNKAQEKYALKKFAPHSVTQLKKLIKIMKTHGYPGEQLIGNDYWMSTILSHHNSITKEYAKKDTLYRLVKPMLKKAIEKGQISPYEFALIDDWYIAVSSDRAVPGYGFLNQPDASTLSETDQLRKEIGLRTIELRNKLVDVEKRTGINLYLPDWIEGKIKVEPN